MDPAEKKARQAAAWARLKRERLDAGLCVRCGTPAAAERSMCEACLAKQRRRRREWWKRKTPAQKAAANAYDRAYREREKRERALLLRQRQLAAARASKLVREDLR